MSVHCPYSNRWTCYYDESIYQYLNFSFFSFVIFLLYPSFFCFFFNIATLFPISDLFLSFSPFLPSVLLYQSLFLWKVFTSSSLSSFCPLNSYLIFQQFSSPLSLFITQKGTHIFRHGIPTLIFTTTFIVFRQAIAVVSLLPAFFVGIYQTN